MGKNFTYFICVEIILLGVGLVSFPTIIIENPHWVIAIGTIPILFLLCWDHLPRAFKFFNVSQWLDLECGARFFRDLLVQPNMAEAVKIFDTMSDPVDGTKNGLTYCFRFYVEDGIKEGQMEVWGVPENGSKAEKLTNPSTTSDEHLKNRERDQDSIKQNGVYYRGLTIRRSSIRSCLELLRKHDAQLEAVSKKGKSG